MAYLLLDGSSLEGTIPQWSLSLILMERGLPLLVAEVVADARLGRVILAIPFVLFAIKLNDRGGLAWLAPRSHPKARCIHLCHSSDLGDINKICSNFSLPMVFSTFEAPEYALWFLSILFPSKHSMEYKYRTFLLVIPDGPPSIGDP